MSEEKTYGDILAELEHIAFCRPNDGVELVLAAGDVYAKTMELGGQISGEHGIGMGKVKYLAQAVGETNMELMRGIKKVFDPKLILNPGKVCYNL